MSLKELIVRKELLEKRCSSIQHFLNGRPTENVSLSISGERDVSFSFFDGKATRKFLSEQREAAALELTKIDEALNAASVVVKGFMQVTEVEPNVASKSAGFAPCPPPPANY